MPRAVERQVGGAERIGERELDGAALGHVELHAIERDVERGGLCPRPAAAVTIGDGAHLSLETLARGRGRRGEERLEAGRERAVGRAAERWDERAVVVVAVAVHVA